MMRRFLPVVLLLITCGAASAGAQSFAVSHAKVDLIAENPALAAGQTAWVGVLFDMEKGWHIYWLNPGDSGQPPSIQWTLPAGFRAGDIRWPVPTRLGTGTVIDYGYQGRVLLAVPLQVAADYKPGATVTLTADVKYLICREVCIPARAHATLSIPSGINAAGDAAARRDLFRSTRERWPKPAPAAWKVAAIDNGGHFVLSVQTGSPETKATFFPFDEDQVDNAAAQVTKPSGRGLQMTLKKSDQLLKPIPALRGVVVLAGGAFEISAPVSVRH